MKKISGILVPVLIFLVFGLLLSLFKARDKIQIPEKSLKYVYNEKKEIRHPAVFYFWAWWCTVCRANQSFTNSSFEIAEKMNTDFISIEEGDSPEKLKNYQEEMNLPYAVAVPINEDFWKTARIKEYPSTVFTNSKGEAVIIDSGILNPVSFLFRLILARFL